MAATLTIFPVPGPGAEDVLVGPDGSVWTGTSDGGIHRLDPSIGRVSRVTTTGGRPLGLEWLPDGRLLVCDALRGLLSVGPQAGDIEVLATGLEGRPFRFPNNAAVAADGTVWFTDSSRRWGVQEWKNDLVEHTRSGRLLRRDPDGTITVVADGLAFANGVALCADESAVHVAETALRRIQRIRLQDGLPVGPALVWVDELPGYPDNIALGSDGLVWVALASPPDPMLTRVQRAPGPLRQLARRLPESVKPSPKRTIRVQAFAADGTLRHDIGADAAEWHMVTGVRESAGQLWVGSLVEPSVARIEGWR